MSAISSKISCSEDVWKGVGATTAILATIVTAVAILTLVKSGGQPSILLYRHPAIITFFVLDVALIIATVVCVSHIFRASSICKAVSEQEPEAPRKENTLPKGFTLPKGRSLPKAVSKPASLSIATSSTTTTDGAAENLAIAVIPTPSAPSSGESTPLLSPQSSAVSIAIDLTGRVPFEKLIIIPLLKAVKGVMKEWLIAAFSSYYCKNDNQKELEERLNALEFSFKEFEKLGVGLATEPLNPKIFSDKQKDFVSIFILGIDFEKFNSKLNWKEEELTPIFCDQLMVFLNRFLFVINKPAPFKDIKYNDFPPGAKTRLADAIGGFDSSNFGAVLLGIKAKLSGDEEKIALNLFKAFQYPIYYSFSDSWRGMPKFRAEFKAKAHAHVTALIKKLEMIKEAPKLQFEQIVSIFQEGCTSFEETLKTLRTKCE